MQKHPQIMVVDDEQSVVKLLSRTLTSEGYGVIAADNGISALELFEKHIPDLVILDISMPGLDGFGVLKLIRQRSSVPVIMLTARLEVNTVHDALALGADDYIRKPFSTQELLARVRTKLRRTAQ